MLNKIRDKFLKFFADNNHYKLSSYSLIPENDPTLLFVNAGMAPMKKFFLNESVPPFINIVTAQRCLRVGGKHNDLQDVGYTKRHHTFFEMLGNFSFGGYGKKEAINYAWKFLTKELCLDVSRLYITVHPNDSEALNEWLNLVEKSKIIKLESNKWSMGDVGPYGYCTEIFYDLQIGDCDFETGDRYLEIWNIVFMEYCKSEKDDYKLPKSCIDTGIGLERITAVLENKTDTYDISFFVQFLPLFNLEKHTPHTKIILDHLRSVSWIVQEGVLPSANNEGYVLRRLIRRMLRSVQVMEIHNFIDIAKIILTEWSKTYSFNIDLILKVLIDEKSVFDKTLTEGLKQCELISKKNKNFSSEDIFVLHDRYGLSVDIVVDLLKENNIKGDIKGFEELLLKQKNKNNISLDLPETEFIDIYELNSEVIAIYDDYIVFNKTPFYAESGGQVGDTGICIGNDFKLKIIDTKKNKKVILHQFELIKGKVNVGDNVKLTIDKERRERIAVHHSCVHLVQHAIDTIYNEVQQMGSFVSENKFRLDFSWENVKELEVEKIEEFLSQIIENKIDSEIKHMELNAAKATGAKAFFKYDSVVRVVKIAGSAELCGGSHIKNTQDLIYVKILKITSVKNGIKRIEGIAGKVYLDYLKNMESIVLNACELFNCNYDNLLTCMKKNIKTNDNVVKLLQKTSKNGQDIGLIMSNQMQSIEDLMGQYKLNIACLIIEKEDKIQVILRSFYKQIDAKEIIKKIASKIGAKGAGGNSGFAQTGGNKIIDYMSVFNIVVENIV